MIRNGDFKIRFTVFDITDIQQLAHTSPSNDLVIAISEWLNTDTDLKNKILDYVRVQKLSH